MRNYVLMVDENTMVELSKIMPKIQYLETAGLDIAGNTDYKILVNPNKKPDEPPVDVSNE